MSTPIQLMKVMIRKYKLILPGLISVMMHFMVISCSHEEEMTPLLPSPDPGESKARITLDARIPGLALPSPKTYGMTQTMEEEVKTLSLLAYREIEGVKRLVVHELFSEADFSVTAGVLRASIHIAQGYYDRIVLIANVDTQVTDLGLESEISALEDWVYEASTDIWPVTGSGYHIPMSATIEATSVNGLSIVNNRTFDNLTLTRMLARIDVVNNAVSSFDLKNVYVYNMNKSGTIVARKSAYGATPKAENLPENVTKITGPLDYNFFGLATRSAKGKEMKGEIYVFEAEKADNSSASTMENSARMLLYGEYNGVDYYYPVDFLYSETDGAVAQGDFMPVIRNHQYTFNVTHVSGIGFSTAEEAMQHQGSFSEMTTETHQLDDDFTDVYYDGQYYLAVNTTNAEKILRFASYSSATTDNTIYVLTNAPNFTIECFNSDGTKADPDLLAPSADSYTGNGDKVKAYLVANANPNATADFDGYVIVNAGNLQSDEIPVSRWFCGREGITTSHEIGHNIYKTHSYPTGESGAMQCWMVENSMEGVFSHIVNDKINGYYYSWLQAATTIPENYPCPEGWNVPDEEQWNKLSVAVNSDLGNTGRWWAGPLGKENNAFAGYVWLNTTVHKDWEEKGYWWSISKENQHISSDNKKINILGYSTHNEWNSVRCVSE